MPSVKLFRMSGESVGQLELSEQVFGAPMNKALVHQAVRVHLMNQRQGTQSALTRTEVSGGGKKPWRQKGTGHARQGSTRSPQWRHGGIVFAPKPRDWSLSLPRKMRRAALRCVLSDKVREGAMIAVDALELSEGKTKLMAQALTALGAKGKALIVVSDKNDFVARASGNLPGVSMAYPGTLNTYDVLNAAYLVVDKAAVAKIEEVYA